MTRAGGVAAAAGVLSAAAAVLHPIPESTASLAHGRNTLAHVLIGLVIGLVGLFALDLDTPARQWQRVSGVAVGASGGLAVASALAVGQVAASDVSLAHEVEASPPAATAAVLVPLALLAVVSLAVVLWSEARLPRPAAVLVVLGVVASLVTGNPGSAVLAGGLLWCAWRLEHPSLATAAPGSA